MNRLKPSAANPITTVRSVRIRISRANAASIEIGGASSSSITSPRTAFFSHWPRGGSLMRKASTATTATGRPSNRNGHRHPNAIAMPPTSSGLIANTVRPTIALVAAILPRSEIG